VTLRIWSSLEMTEAEGTSFGARLAPFGVLEPDLQLSNVAFGQPGVDACLASTQLAWVHLNSAGWDRFDRPEVRAQFGARNLLLSNSAGVYSEPCAQHLLAFMLADARQLPRSLSHQLGDHGWPQLATRAACRLLGPEATVALVGFGSIAARIAQLLAPFGARVVGARRNPTGDESVPVLPMTELPRLLAEADHVVDILPGGPATKHFFDAALFSRMKRGATFYNIGRGSTVDQSALLDALATGQLRAAYLDVTEPEPLPPAHPLWQAPGCTITPHAAGGHAGEAERLLSHFLQNLARFAKQQPLLDRVL
jgi:phosphoglycerate dehydrogenase-like enzyme